MAKTPEGSNPNQGSPWDSTVSSLKLWNALLILIVGITIILVVLRICGGILYSSSSYLMSASVSEEAAEEAVEEPAAYLPEPSQLPDPTPTTSLQPGEVTDKTMVISNTRLGEVSLTYPVRVGPQTSNIIRLTISRPPLLASSDPTSFLIIEIDQYAINNETPIHGDLFSDKSTILVDDQMKVELSAQAFEIEPHFPAIQAIDMENPDVTTNWAWTVTAPQAQGVHVLNFSVFVDEESQSPSWFGAYQLEVLAPTPSPPDQSISSPESSTQARIVETSIFDSVNQFVDLLTVFSTISAGVIAIKRRHLKRQVDLTEILKQYEPANEMEEIELRERISKLESIKWWQFWK